MQFVYEYYRIEQQERLLLALNAAVSSCAVVPVYRSSFKSLLSPRSPKPSFRNSLLFFAP